MDWKSSIEEAHGAMQVLEKTISDLTHFRDQTTATIAQYLRVESGIELDIDAIQATLTRPYTLLPINEHEAWLIHWRGVKMPIFGWVVAQEAAFLKARVTRSMDLLTPLPGWMKDELGWKAPEHKAIISADRSTLKITQGQVDSFKRKYGRFLGTARVDEIKIKGGDAWIKLVAALVRDGILPYAPAPVHHDHWIVDAVLPDLLARLIEKKQQEAGSKYIEQAAYEFLTKGAVLVNYPPGSGKTLTACLVLNYFQGRVLLLADTTMLIDQWRDRLKELAPNANVTLSTYQGAGKYLKEEWDLIIPDEAQRLPANTFSKLAFIKTKYRLGLTGTAWREDDRQHLIVALSGFPVALRWSELIRAGALRRPRIVVATVTNDAAKTGYVKQLLARRKGRALIFCDWLQQGQALADALGVPFVHGDTPHKLERIQESDVCVVSRIGDRGLSLTDLRLVIEVAGAGSAREQFAQRVGRLLHGDFEGEFYTVFTPEEAAKYRGRVFGVEAELAGSVDIEFIQVGHVTTVTDKAPRMRPARRAERVAASISAVEINAIAESPRDEIEQVMRLPSVAAKIALAQKNGPEDIGGYIVRVLRYCWKAALSPKEVMEAKGLTGSRTLIRLTAACRAAESVKLLIKDEDGRYRVNQAEIERLKVLSEL